jgi:hypothetical protein
MFSMILAFIAQTEGKFMLYLKWQVPEFNLPVA